jgi:hypothetical protein
MFHAMLALLLFIQGWIWCLNVCLILIKKFFYTDLDLMFECLTDPDEFFYARLDLVFECTSDLGEFFKEGWVLCLRVCLHDRDDFFFCRAGFCV